MNIIEKAKTRLKRALLIDDDKVSHFINRNIIEDLDLVDECNSHYNGATALQVLRYELMMGLPSPEVIILDLNMPVMGGLEFLQNLNDRVGLSFLLKRIIVLSSSDCASDVAKVKKLGVRWHLTKPLLREALTPILTTLRRESKKALSLLDRSKRIRFDFVSQLDF